MTVDYFSKHFTLDVWQGFEYLSEVTDCYLEISMFVPKWEKYRAWWATYLNTYLLSDCIRRKMRFTIKDFFSKCGEIRSFLRIWSHLLKTSLVENFLFWALLLYLEEQINVLSKPYIHKKYNSDLATKVLGWCQCYLSVYI